jgi:sulfur-carrier protein adenylyltransferase/sulfurtransferase
MHLPPLVEPVAALTAAERARTARHASLRVLGELGQRRLAAAHVAVVGAGGLGSPVILGLAAAGIGTLTIIDDDEVEISNLQRQVIHRHSDVGSGKVDSAVRAAKDLAPEGVVHPVHEHLTPGNAASILRGADLVIDGTDTFETREAVAGACESLGIPLVWGTVQEFDAQVTVFWTNPPAGIAARLLADLYPPGSVGELPTCAAVGVLGTVCLQVGSLLATEAIKLITGIGDSLFGRVLVVDGLNSRQWEVPLGSPTNVDAATTPLSAPQPSTSVPHPTISARDLADALAAGAADAIIDVREAGEVANGMIPGAVHLPLADLLADPSTVRGPVILVCHAGSRATRAADALTEAGIPATVLAGGMLAWAASVETEHA